MSFSTAQTHIRLAIEAIQTTLHLTGNSMTVPDGATLTVAIGQLYAAQGLLAMVEKNAQEKGVQNG